MGNNRNPKWLKAKAELGIDDTSTGLLPPPMDNEVRGLERLDQNHKPSSSRPASKHLPTAHSEHVNDDELVDIVEGNIDRDAFPEVAPNEPLPMDEDATADLFMNDDEDGQILDNQIYASVKVECVALLPHLTVLSGGQMRKDGGGRLNAYKAASVEPAAAEAAEYVYAWLTHGSTLRSILKFLSKGGVFYTAFANEKLTRAYIVGNKVTEEDFMKLCLHRLSNPEPADESLSADRVTDWARVKAG